MKYFTHDEFLCSERAKELGIVNEYPNLEYRLNVEDLVRNVLDKLRAEIGLPITVTSGYRCPRLNVAVGGACNSLHMYGKAADITCELGAKELFLRLLDKYEFSELIWYRSKNIVHVAYDYKSISNSKILIKK